MDKRIEQMVEDNHRGIESLKIEFQNLDKKIDKVEKRMDRRMDTLENKLFEFQIYVENELVHPMKLLCENLAPLVKEWSSEKARTDRMEEDIDVLKKVAANHSEQLKKLG